MLQLSSWDARALDKMDKNLDGIFLYFDCKNTDFCS